MNLKANLYKLWNRLLSGSYLPPPVKAVEIPKRDGKGTRRLGIPTVADRIAQTVVKMALEPEVEPIFDPDSYGYRPGRSAHEAVEVCRERCWRADWVVDLNIRSFFDTVPHDLIAKAVSRHTTERWIVLYLERWLKGACENSEIMRKGWRSSRPIASGRAALTACLVALSGLIDLSQMERVLAEDPAVQLLSFENRIASANTALSGLDVSLSSREAGRQPV